MNLNNTYQGEAVGQQQVAGRRIEITTEDLPLSCPPRSSGLWNSHPRVYLPIEAGAMVRCPYCSTEYVLRR